MFKMWCALSVAAPFESSTNSTNFSQQEHCEPDKGTQEDMDQCWEHQECIIYVF